MQDQTPTTWVDGTTTLDDNTLNTEIRNAAQLLLNPPMCGLSQNTVQSITLAGYMTAWAAVVFNNEYYDTEDPTTPMFAVGGNLWDFEDGTAQGWTLAGVTGTAAAASDIAYDGVYALKATTTAAGTPDMISATVAAAPGNTGKASTWVYSSVARTITLTVAWRNAGNTSTLGTFTGSAVAVAANTWTQLTAVGGAAPASTGLARIELLVTSGGNGDVYRVDNAQLSVYTAPSRITITTPGWYECVASAEIQGNTGNFLFNAAFRVNGSVYYYGSTVGRVAEALDVSPANLIELNAGDYVEFVITTDITTAITLSNSNASTFYVARRRGQ